MKITKVSKFKNQLGEGVWWDDDNMLLHWTDILEGNYIALISNPKRNI